MPIVVGPFREATAYVAGSAVTETVSESSPLSVLSEADDSGACVASEDGSAADSPPVCAHAANDATQTSAASKTAAIFFIKIHSFLFSIFSAAAKCGRAQSDL